MTTRRTIRIEVTDQDHLDDPFALADREQATLVREFAMTMGHDLSPAQVVDRIRGWLDKPPVVGIRLPSQPAECQHEAWESNGGGRRCADCREWLGGDS